MSHSPSFSNMNIYIVHCCPMASPISKTEQGTKYIMNHTSNHQVLEWSLTLWLVGKAWVEQVALMELSEWSKGQNTNITSPLHYSAITFLAFFTSCKSAYMCSFLSNGFSSKNLTYYIFSSKSVALFFPTSKVIMLYKIISIFYMENDKFKVLSLFRPVFLLYFYNWICSSPCPP